VVVWFLAVVALAVVLLWVLSMLSRPIADRSRPSGRSPVAIVGDRVCQECHTIEAGQHRRSGHARTLRPAAEIDLARWLSGRSVVDPERPEAGWTYSLKDGRLEAERTEKGQVDRQTLEFALGSGRHATTFVTLTGSAEGPPGSREHRLTYFAASQTLGITPGQRASDHESGVNAMGRDRDPLATALCFGCHATTISDSSPRIVDVATMRPGVGCERCHGPGGEHVAAADRGETNLTMPFAKVWTAEGQMRLCGACHRHPSQAPPGEIRVDNPKIARFQPVGLMQSKCYTHSDGALSCVNCHNPHDHASNDRAVYEAACLECHKPGGKGRTLCPVSPRDNCLGCHMPALDTGQGILFTDHWIRIRKDRGEPGGGGAGRVNTPEG
jgi:hypothetical protein